MRIIGARLAIGLMLALLAGPALSQAEGPERDLNANAVLLAPKRLAGGRVASVLIDRYMPKRVYALSESGGLFVSSDAGQTWASNVTPEGAPGLVGHGLAGTGASTFFAIAQDPVDGNRLLMLVADDDRRSLAASVQGVWLSVDRGVSWKRAVQQALPCRLTGIGFVRYARKSADAFATTPCGLLVTHDAGASWVLTSPFASDPTPNLTGFAYSTPADLVAVCGFARRADGTSARMVGIFDPVAGKGLAYPGPDTGTDAGGACSLAFDPRDPTRLFMATQGKVAGLSEGHRSLGEIVWRDLRPPTIGGHVTNGRPAAVQTAITATGRRVFFHDKVYFMSEDCSSQTEWCPSGPSAPAALATPPECVDDPGQPWRCVDVHHPDLTEIAFDLASPSCPLLVAGDGGISVERDDAGTPTCGVFAGAGAPPATSARPGNVGLHALQPSQAAFAGRGADTFIGLALQDNGFEWSGDRGKTWSISPCGDGFRVRALGNTALQRCNNAYDYRPDARSKTAAGWFRAGPPPDFMQWDKDGWWGDFIEPGVFLAPTARDGRLQLYALDAAANAWAPYGPASTGFGGLGLATGDGTRMAISNRLNEGPLGFRTVYVVVPVKGAGQGHDLFCLSFGGVGWRQSVDGPLDPVRVWASDGEEWALAYDASSGALYSSRGDCQWKREAVASDLMTQSGSFLSLSSSTPAGPVPISGVAFDPGRPGRAAVATQSAGILITENHGGTWRVSRAFPEPSRGVTDLHFDDSGISSGTLEPALASAWGRGVWAIDLGRASYHATGISGSSAALAQAGGAVPLELRCPKGAPCHGTAKLSASAGRGSMNIGAERFSLRPGRRARVLVPLNRAGRRLAARRPRLVIDAAVTTIDRERGRTRVRRTIVRTSRRAADRTMPVSLSLRCGDTRVAHERLLMGGIEPPEARGRVSLVVTAPSGVRRRLTAVTDPGGAFRASLVADRAGRWSARATRPAVRGYSTAASTCAFRATPARPGRPDLVIESLESGTVTIANRGAREAFGPFSVVLRGAGGLQRVVGLNHVRRRGRIAIPVDCHTGRLRAVVDPNDRVAESNEHNNDAHATVSFCVERDDGHGADDAQ